MIKKLRRRIILVNMLLVGIVILLIFAEWYIVTVFYVVYKNSQIEFFEIMAKTRLCRYKTTPKIPRTI